MNFKADLIEALQDTITNQSKVINGLLVNGDRLQQVIDAQTKVIETLTQLKEQSDDEVERLEREVARLEHEVARVERLSIEQSKVINEFRNEFRNGF